jgi:hypothetical protein
MRIIYARLSPMTLYLSLGAAPHQVFKEQQYKQKAICLNIKIACLRARNM